MHLFCQFLLAGYIHNLNDFAAETNAYHQIKGEKYEN